MQDFLVLNAVILIRDGTRVTPAGAVGFDEFATGPFAKYFVKKRKAKVTALSADVIKSEAQEILRCCLEGKAEHAVPALRLNYDKVITAWSNRGELWVNPVGGSASVRASIALTMVC